MTLVIDASVALKWVLDERGSEAAEALRTQDLIAPELWLVESANALWVQVRRGNLEPEEASGLFSDLQRAPVTTSPIRDDIGHAQSLALRLAHPVYHCLYLALALRKGIDVITDDRRFHAASARSPEFAGRVRLLVP